VHPVLFTLFGHPFYAYGACAAVGFLAAVWLWGRMGRSSGRKKEDAGDLGAALLLSGIAGARAAYVAANWSFFARNPAEIVRIDHGGLIFYGGFLAGCLALVLFARLKKWKLLDAADFAIVGLAAAHAWGRVGCFTRGCCHGGVAAKPWLGVVYPADCDAIPAALQGIPLYPVQLAEALLLGVVTVVLWRAWHKPHAPGAVFGLYLLLYPPIRFCLEFFRGDERQAAAGFLDIAQAVSIALFAIGIAWTLAVRKRAAR
jgi:phosphatidylglycerol:prolipoprotein diacylglycerol transferase